MSLVRIHCRFCGSNSTHRAVRIRMTSDTYLFTCPTCRVLRVKPMDETSRGMLLLAGAHPTLVLPNVLAFVASMQNYDDLAAVAKAEVAV